jgi:hypothetical protein
VRETEPPKGSMATMALTSPYQIVKLPRGDYKLKVVRAGQ